MKVRLLSATLTILLSAIAVFAQTTEFTYQGSLQSAGTPANGTYDFEFRLYDAVSGGGQVGTLLTRSSVAVVDGIFSVTLDFGVLSFPGAPRFLEIRARTTGAPSFTLLDPRQKLTSSPFAIRTLAANAADSLSANCTLCVTDAHILAVGGNKLSDGTVTTSKLADGSVTESKLSLSVIGSPERNLALLGSLRWDLLKAQADVPVGTGPRGVVFDGANIWVSNQSSNDVTKIRVSDGAILGTFPVSTAPAGLAFDGANIWVAHSSGNALIKLRASDGANLGTIATISGFDVVFDGTHVWVPSFNGGQIGKYRVSDGVNLGFFVVGSFPRGVAFDGTNIWVAGGGMVRRIRASDGAAVGGLISVGTNPVALAFDGSNIWVVNSGSNNVSKINAISGTVVGTFAAGTAPNGIAFDGTNMWVTNSNGVNRLRASDGTSLGTLPANSPQGIAFDGSNMWATGTNNVRRMSPAFP
jgi:hypothetical protein